MLYPAACFVPSKITFVIAVMCWFTAVDSVLAQFDAAASRMRPIGSPSAVDRFQSVPGSVVMSSTGGGSAAVEPPRQVVRNETAYWQQDQNVISAAAPLHQTVWMQSGLEAPPRSNPGMTLPDSAPDAGLPQPRSGPMLPNSSTFLDPNASRALPPPPAGGGNLLYNGPNSGLLSSDYAPSLSDLSPVPQPTLATQTYARVDNCALVTPPSSYMAASAFGGGCGQVIPTSYGIPATSQVMPPAEIVSGAVLPPVTVLPPTISQPLAYPASAAPARSLITLGQQNYTVQVGQGLWGQPVAYVPGQCCRNWLRYLSP